MATQAEIVTRLAEINDEIEAVISPVIASLINLRQEQKDLIIEGQRDHGLLIKSERRTRNIQVMRVTGIKSVEKLFPVQP